jgi:hypothetical protein
MSIRETTAKDIIIVLGQIEDPKLVLVSREPFEPEKLAITQFPSVLVTSRDEENSTVSMGAPSNGIRMGNITYEIRGFIRGNELDSKRNDLIESIEEALDTDRYRNQPGVIINSQVTNIEIIDRLPPLAEFMLTYVVNYQHRRTVS